MKSLSLSTPRLIILVGIPGAGKTHFGEKFADTFGAPYVNTGAIRRTLSDQPTYSSDEQYTTDMLSLLQLGELLKTHKTILFEGSTHTRAHRTHIAKLAKNHGYDTLFVWVQTDPSTAKRRATRSTQGKQTHTITGELFDQLSTRFVDLDKTEQPLVVISGRHTYASQARPVLKRLAEPHKQAVQSEKLVVPPRQRTKNSIKIS